MLLLIRLPGAWRLTPCQIGGQEEEPCCFGEGRHRHRGRRRPGKAAALALAREGAPWRWWPRPKTGSTRWPRRSRSSGQGARGSRQRGQPEDCARRRDRHRQAGGHRRRRNGACGSDALKAAGLRSPSELIKVYEVNLWGPLQLTQACVPSMRARGGGSVVNIASMSARHIRPNDGGYSTSKGALLTATKSMAMDLAAYKIRVNAVAPGYHGPKRAGVHTGRGRNGITPDEVVAEITKNIRSARSRRRRTSPKRSCSSPRAIRTMKAGAGCGRRSSSGERRRGGLEVRTPGDPANRAQPWSPAGPARAGDGDGVRAAGSVGAGRGRRRPDEAETVDLVQQAGGGGCSRDGCHQPGSGDGNGGGPVTVRLARLR